MGNSAVSDSYAIARDHTYLLADRKVVTNRALHAWRRGRADSTSTNPYDATSVRRTRLRDLKILHERE